MALYYNKINERSKWFGYRSKLIPRGDNLCMVMCEKQIKLIVRTCRHAVRANC